MPTLAETAPHIHEQFAEQPTEVIRSTTAPDQKIDGSVLPEMPNSHPGVDAATISVSGLIMNCKRFADMYMQNPESAMIVATKTVQNAQEVSALREQGMSAKEIKAKMLADNLARARDKAAIVGKEEKAKTEQEPEPKAETTQTSKPRNVELRHAQNPAQERVLSKQKLPQEHMEVLQAIQQREDKKPLEDATEEVAYFSEQNELAIKTHQKSAVETQIIARRDEGYIEQQRVGALTHNHEHVTSQEKLLFDKPKDEQLPDVPLSIAPVREFVSAGPAKLVYEDEVRQTTPSTTEEAPEQVFEVVDAEALIRSQRVEFDFEEIIETDEPEISAFDLPVLVAAETDVIDDMPQAPTVLKVELDEQLELRFELEVVDTYKELLVLIEGKKAEPDELHVNSERIAELDDTVKVSAAETALQEAPEQDFETFIASQPVIENVALETIKEQSNEQPLEQTLVQLVEYLSKTPEDIQPDSLTVIIEDLAKALPNCYVSQGTEEARLQITPEMTDKLLALLRELGYQNPREELVHFVNKFGFAFLVQSLAYLLQLTDEEHRRESLSISVSASNSDDNSISRLSKLILKLTMSKEPLSVSIAA